MSEENTRMTVTEILEKAHEKEAQAREFYRGLAEQEPPEAVLELLEKLADEEYKHMHLIEQMQTNLNLGKDPAHQ